MDVITNSGTDLLYMVTLGLGNQDCVKIEFDIYRELDPMVYSIQMCEQTQLSQFAFGLPEKD